MFNEAWAFIKDVFSHWKSAMNGSVGIAIGAAQATGHFRSNWFWWVAAAFVFVATYQAWCRQYRARLAAEKLAEEKRREIEALQVGAVTRAAATLERIEGKLSPSGTLVAVRSLAKDQSARILREIKATSGKVSVYVQDGTTDGQWLGHDLRDVFSDAGWTVDYQVIPLRGVESVPGLVLLVVAPSDLTDDQKAITRILRAAGLAFETRKRKADSDVGYDTQLWVTEKFS